MIAPGSCCALVITGRKEGSKGAYFGWMAEKRLEMGAQEALNLDGGGTSALVFMAMFSTVRKTACPCAKERAERATGSQPGTRWFYIPKPHDSQTSR